jgi:hypothetical protein
VDLKRGRTRLPLAEACDGGLGRVSQPSRGAQLPPRAQHARSARRSGPCATGRRGRGLHLTRLRVARELLVTLALAPSLLVRSSGGTNRGRCCGTVLIIASDSTRSPLSGKIFSTRTAQPAPFDAEIASWRVLSAAGSLSGSTMVCRARVHAISSSAARQSDDRRRARLSRPLRSLPGGGRLLEPRGLECTFQVYAAHVLPRQLARAAGWGGL